MQFNAKDLVHYNVENIHNNIPEKLSVLFDDGILIETTNRKVIYSWYAWEMHRQYPNTPVLSRHLVDNVLKGQPLNAKTHRDLLSNIYKDVALAYNLITPRQTEHLLELVYKITNNIHNFVSKTAEAYVTSIDILDFIGIIEHPVIKKANDGVEANNASIGKAYAKVLETVRTDPTLTNNALARAVRAGMVNANQVTQCVSVRGFMTEVDGSIMPVPIFSNFTRGMKSLYNFVAESRSAAKSYYFAEAPLEDSEYFARRLQLLCMTVERIRPGDCGSSTYMDWRVTPPSRNDKGDLLYPGDLKFMVGKYYLDESTNSLKMITHDDPNLHDKVLKLRTVLHCVHPDKHSVCEVCFGGLSKNVSRFANIGHLCCATMTQQTSQSVLSIKHYDASSVGTGISLSVVSSRYFSVDNKKSAYKFKGSLTNLSPRITVARDEAPGLTDILNVSNIDNINPMRVSSIDCIEVSTSPTGNGDFKETVTISQDGRNAVMTKEFLEYLKIKKWSTDARNNFVFDLEDWDFDKPMFKLPEMEYSFSDHSKQIAAMIESNMENITDRSNPNSPISTLQELFILVNSKLNVNLAALEVIIYASMVKDVDSYQMSRNQPKPVLGVANAIIKNRTLSNSYAFRDVLYTLYDPKSFFKLDRSDSPFDVFIAPNDVVKAYRGTDDRYNEV